MSEEYSQSLKKISKMGMTMMNFKELHHYNKNNYIKSETNRKLYANKSDKKLYYDQDMDEDELNEIAIANKRISQMVFSVSSYKGLPLSVD